MLITNATLVTWNGSNEILPESAVLIKDGRIAEIMSTTEAAMRCPQEECLDAAGQWVMPGNICAHTHFYGAYARGLSIPASAPADFPEILSKLWWPLDKSLDAEAVYYSAMVCLIDAVKHGTTTLIDHHASPNAIPGSLDLIAKAVKESGLRAALCYEVTDRDGSDLARAGIAENIRFLKKVKQDFSCAGMIGAMFGLHASLTLSDETLVACRKAVENLDEQIGFHIHVAEHDIDEIDSLEKSGMRVVNRLHHFGILGSRSIVVHAVHVDPREIEILSETNTWVSHQPRSNMNNGVGLPAVELMMNSGIRVCLGNDGFSNAMWEEWKSAYLAHKLVNRDPRRMPADLIQKMAVENNRELAKLLLGSPRLGVIEPGAAADLIIVNYQPFTQVTSGNLPWHIIFGFHESMVQSTIVGGKVLMRDRKLLFLDEERIAFEARQRAPQVWQRYTDQFKTRT